MTRAMAFARRATLREWLVFGLPALGGLGGVSPLAQLMGTALGIVWALLSGAVVYGVLKATMGLRLSAEEEYEGADLSIHRISATPEREAIR